MIDDRVPPVYRHSWAPSAVFNIMFAILPIIAAYAISISFSGVPYLGTPTPEALAETRQEIDRNFANFAAKGDEARENWANLIETELKNRNMSAVRGFLLAAPDLLPSSDARAIIAAADDVPSGSLDERMLMASLIFLPSDIRIKYEGALSPSTQELASLENASQNTESFDVAQASLLSASDVAPRHSNLTRSRNFFVLGTVEDLVSRSRDWMRGNRQRSIEMRLTGIAMASPPSATGLEQEHLMTAASILKTAWRSKRLSSTYARQIEQKLELALPEETLTANLETALADVATLQTRAKQVQDAFAASIDENATRRLGPELETIAQLAEDTSPRGVLKILEHVEAPVDLERAKLLTRAGGDRAVALMSLMGSDALHISRSGIKWSRDLVIGIIGFTLAFIVMLLSAFNIIATAIFGTRKDDDDILYY